MIDMYTNEEASKKKYLVPLVILMLCAVSLTGAAYAYSTNVTDTKEVSSMYDDKFDFELTAGNIYFDVDKNKSTGVTTYTFNETDSVHVVKVQLKEFAGKTDLKCTATIDNAKLKCTVTDIEDGVCYINIENVDDNDVLTFTDKAKVGPFTVTVTVNGESQATTVN